MLKKEGKIWTFLLENDVIAEIHCSLPDSDQHRQPVLGDIYIGKVKNIAANIGAAFIEIAPGKECYYDLSQAPQAIFTHKIGKKPLCIGDELVVQISREAVKTKAPTVSSNINFTGRYAVLTTGNTRIGTSGKLPRSLRDTYKEKLSHLKNEDYGLIIRTNAKDVPFETVLEEIQKLENACVKLKETAPFRTCFSCLQEAPPSYITDLKMYTQTDCQQSLPMIPSCISRFTDFCRQSSRKISPNFSFMRNSFCRFPNFTVPTLPWNAHSKNTSG